MGIVGTACVGGESMSDIVERLRNRRGTITSLCDDAADEIERLRAEVKRWSNWAIDYACDDIKCDCDRCTDVRTAWNGDR